MPKRTVIKLEAQQTAMRLNQRIVRYYDALQELQHITELLFKTAPDSAEDIDAWFAREGFGVDTDGFWLSLPLLSAFRDGQAPADPALASEGRLQADLALNVLREKVKSALRQRGAFGEQKEGMDLALCILDPAAHRLHFAGAYNPIYLIRDGEDYGHGRDGLWCLGSKHFAEKMKRGSYRYAVLIDMIGDKDLDIHPERNSESAAGRIYAVAYEYADALGYMAFKAGGGYDIIDDHHAISYGEIWDAFYTTDDKPNGMVWDMYSDTPGETPPTRQPSMREEGRKREWV